MPILLKCKKTQQFKIRDKSSYQHVGALVKYDCCSNQKHDSNTIVLLGTPPVMRYCWLSMIKPTLSINNSLARFCSKQQWLQYMMIFVFGMRLNIDRLYTALGTCWFAKFLIFKHVQIGVKMMVVRLLRTIETIVLEERKSNVTTVKHRGAIVKTVVRYLSTFKS